MNIFYILVSIWVVIGMITFVYLFFESAPYGRHIKDGWGFKIPAKLGWVVMESPCVILMIAYSLIVQDQLEILHYVFLFIWLTHYICLLYTSPSPRDS